MIGVCPGASPLRKALGQQFFVRGLEFLDRLLQVAFRGGGPELVLRGEAGDALLEHALAAADIDDGGGAFMLRENTVEREVRREREQRDQTKGEEVAGRQPPLR